MQTLQTFFTEYYTDGWAEINSIARTEVLTVNHSKGNPRESDTMWKPQQMKSYRKHFKVPNEKVHHITVKDKGIFGDEEVIRYQHSVISTPPNM